jgi:hypothetical protein
MRLLIPGALVAALVALGCGSDGMTKVPGAGDAEIAGIVDDGGVPGRRGGGGGAFGGGEDDAGGASIGDAAVAPGEDAPAGSGEDAPLSLDSGRDRNRDTSGITHDSAGPGPDLAPAPDLATSPDLAISPDTNPADPCSQCPAIEAKYADALTRARVCNPIIKAQCQSKVSASLSCPCSQTWVNNTTEVDAVAKMYQDAGCGKCRHICPLLCRVLSSGVCNPSKLALPIDPGPGPDPVPPIVADKGTCADMNDTPAP